MRGKLLLVPPVRARMDEVVEVNGVRIVGLSNLPGRVPRTASQMYSNNLSSFVEHFWNKESKEFILDPNQPLMKGCLITHDGAVCHETIRGLVEKQPAVAVTS